MIIKSSNDLVLGVGSVIFGILALYASFMFHKEIRKPVFNTWYLKIWKIWIASFMFVLIIYGITIAINAVR